MSPGVLRMVGRVGAMVSFEEGHALLHALAGVDVPTTHVERAAEALGREIAQDERRRIESPPATAPVAPTLYLGMDGTGVPMRASELVGRAGTPPAGGSKTREVTLRVVWSAEGRDDEGAPVRDPDSVTYSAAIERAAQRDTDEAPSPFATRVARETARRGFAQAARRAVLGDGAPWIWNLATEHFPDAIQIAELHIGRAGVGREESHGTGRQVRAGRAGRTGPKRRLRRAASCRGGATVDGERLCPRSGRTSGQVVGGVGHASGARQGELQRARDQARGGRRSCDDDGDVQRARRVPPARAGDREPRLVRVPLLLDERLRAGHRHA